MKCIFITIAAICLALEGGTALPLSSISISGGSHSTHESTSVYHGITGPLTTTTTVVKPSLVNLRSSGLISINGIGLPSTGSVPILGGFTTQLTGGLPLLNQFTTTGIRHHVIGGDLGQISHVTTTADLPSSVLYTTTGGFDGGHYIEHPILSKSHSHILTDDSNIDNTVVQQDGVYKAVSAGAVHIAPLPGRGSTTSINT